MLGGHAIKHWSFTQTSISLSSGEAEFAGVIRGVGQGLGCHGRHEEAAGEEAADRGAPAALAGGQEGKFGRHAPIYRTHQRIGTHDGNSRGYCPGLRQTGRWSFGSSSNNSPVLLQITPVVVCRSERNQWEGVVWVWTTA